ncbi:MAG: ABC-type transport auxiliary lipoprotein family protein [Methyloligellaceae bacterium]
MARSYFVAAIATAIVLPGLGGCTGIPGLGGEAPPETYDLLATKPKPLAKSRRTAYQMVVSEPSSVRALATDRILVKPRSEAISYFPKVQWSDRLPALLQKRLIESLARSRRFAAVGGGSDRIDADIRFATNIRAFQIEVNGAGAQARISLFVKIFNEKSGRIIASHNFEATVPAPKDNVQGAVAAMNGGLQLVLAKIITWSAHLKVSDGVKPPSSKRAPADAISRGPVQRG